MTLRRPLLVAIAVAAVCVPISAQPTPDLNLMPYPKSVVLGGEGPALTELRVLELPADVPDGVASMLLEEIARAGVPAPQVVRTPGDAAVAALLPAATEPVRPAAPRRRGPEAYGLRCDTSGVAIAGAGPRGLACGIQTLRQLIRANSRDGRLPGVRIQDWPSLTWRAFQDDLTRGPSSKLGYLTREIDIGAYLKLNVLTYYMESQYAFAKHATIPPPDGALTPDELDELVRHGAEHNVEIMGNQQSFAHMERILWRPEFAAIAETPYLLNPSSEETYSFLDDLYSEVLPHLTFPFFNVCCDETYGLGSGPSKERVAREGEGAVYVDHILRLHDLVAGKYGRRMMMWGDIILSHPDQLDRIPKDVTMLTWGYGAADSFEGQILPFARSGFEFFVCPGTSNWSRVLPDFTTSVRNIEQFLRDGTRNGALGCIITSWDDDGLTVDPQNWYGFAWGAECAWTGSATRHEDFERRLGAVLFGEPNGEFGKAMAILREVPVRSNAAFFAGPTERAVMVDRAQGEAQLAAAEPARKRLQEAIGHLDACARGASANADLVAYFRHGVRRLGLIDRREEDALWSGLCYCSALDGEIAPAAALWEIEGRQRAARRAHAQSRDEFVRLWRAINRPYALEWSLAGYDRVLASYDAMLAKLESARRAAERTGELPPAEDLGFAVDIAPSPRLSPAHTVPEPMRPDSPWTVAGASNRVGLSVHVTGAGATPLPVEVELDLPPDLARGPVRALLATGADGTTDVPAQLGPGQRQGRVRLALVLPPDTRAGDVTLWAYFGAPAPSPLPGAVTLSRADGEVWLENDRVRVMIGSEGAHIYRWEAKALGGRDVTLAGETGYAGFSDENVYRGVPHGLYPAATGPALARCYASTPDGLVKTFSLYAGASWVEVTFSRPVTYYWDFEDPALFQPGEPGGARFIFENGAEGPAPTPPGDVSQQVSAEGVHWGGKYVPCGLLLAVLTPDDATRLVVGPGAGAGGVGIERAAPVSHFVTYCDVPDSAPATVLSGLVGALRLDALPEVTAYGIESRSRDHATEPAP